MGMKIVTMGVDSSNLQSAYSGGRKRGATLKGAILAILGVLLIQCAAFGTVTALDKSIKFDSVNNTWYYPPDKGTRGTELRYNISGMDGESVTFEFYQQYKNDETLYRFTRPDILFRQSVFKIIVTNNCNGVIRVPHVRAKYIHIKVTEENPAGTSTQLRQTVGGQEIVDSYRNINEFQQKLAVAGDGIGIIFINKFGRDEDVDILTLPCDVWSLGGLYVYNDTPVTLYASSTSGSDTVEIEVQGVDENWKLQTQTVTLTGQAQAAIPGTWLRAFRALNSDSTNLTGNVYIAESDSLTGGVPDTTSKIKAFIDQRYQQSTMTQYTVPLGYTAFFRRFMITVGGTAPNFLNSPRAIHVTFDCRFFGKVFRSLSHYDLITTGTGSITHDYDIYFSLPEKTDIKFTSRGITFNDGIINVFYDIILVKN
jgi:hypothetical protein